MRENCGYDPQDLFERLTQISFAMDDLRLFLDTHPGHREALSTYEDLRQKRRAVKKMYQEAVGPVDFYSPGGETRWNWVQQPWPWEKED